MRTRILQRSTGLETLLEDLTAERAGVVRREIADKRWKIAKIARQRRIFIAAPDFDFPTRSAVAFLKDRFASADLKIDLLSITPNGKGFAVRPANTIRPSSVSALRGECGMTPRGRLLFVLPGDDKGLVVNIGRLKDGKLRLPQGAAATQHLLRRRTGSLIPYVGPFLPDHRRLGAVWRHRSQVRTATVLLTMSHPSLAGKKLIYFVREDAGKLHGYRIRSEAAFEENYQPTPDINQNWPRLLKSAV